MAKDGFLWIFALGLAVLGPHAFATNYFVSTTGSNANPGTNLALPFQTILRASTNMVAGDTCFIRAGSYHETIQPLASGTSNAPITFTAYSNEVVTIDSGSLVTGWTLVSNGIYQASVNWSLGPGNNQIFVDGVMVHEAQYPNYGTGDVLHPATVPVSISTANTNVVISSAWSGKPTNYWAGAWFSGGIGMNWAWQTAQVISSYSNTITLNPTTETGSWWFNGQGVGYLWDSLAFVNADNEWYLQTNSTGYRVYLRITGGANPATHIVTLKQRNWCINVTSENYITISNLNFIGGAVSLQGNGNVLQNCQAQYLSHYMIITAGYAEKDSAMQCGGIIVNGSDNLIRNCTVDNTAGTGIYISGTNNIIRRNLIYNTDYSGTYACCLITHGTMDTIVFNTLYSSGRDIIRPEGTGSDIRFNDFSEPGVLCKDLGVLYVNSVNSADHTGPATRIAYNWVHDNDYPTPAPLIYLDNYDANFVIDHNVCWNTGGDTGIRINRPAQGDYIYNNTLFNCAAIGMNTYDSWPGGNPDITLWPTDLYEYTSANNLFLTNSPQAQLINWTNEDFRLKAGAPAVNAGVVLPGFTDGFAGSAPDLGAYESGLPPWIAGIKAKPSFTMSIKANAFFFRTSPDAVFYSVYVATNTTVRPINWQFVTNLSNLTSNQFYLPLTSEGNGTKYFRLQSPY